MRIIARLVSVKLVAMPSTTLAYDAHEDRIWLSFNDDGPRLWLTRRLIEQVFSHGLILLEQTTAGAQGGADASTRIALEHELSLNELLPGEQKLPIKMGKETQAQTQRESHVLCTGVTMNFGPENCSFIFLLDEGQRQLSMSRVMTHRWLHGLYLAVGQARWSLAHVPTWLSQSQLPASIQALTQKPLPEGLADGNTPTQLPPTSGSRPPPAGSGSGPLR